MSGASGSRVATVRLGSTLSWGSSVSRLSFTDNVQSEVIVSMESGTFVIWFFDTSCAA